MSIRKGVLSDLLCDEDEWAWFEGPSRRPMPSTTVCILKVTKSAEHDSRKRLPSALTNFLSAIGKLPVADSGSGPVQELADTNEKTTPKRKKPAAFSIDDSSLSTLAPGKHKRYLTLLSTKQRWKPAQRKEFNKLHSIVMAEQRAYHQALVQFWDANKERVLTGFSQSSRSLLAAKFAEAAVDTTGLQGSVFQHFQGRAYGRCLQVVSLEQPSQASKTRTWTVDEIKCHDLTPNNQGRVQQMDGLPKIGSTVPLPKQVCPSLLLKDDKTALTIATQNNIMVAATLEALETLLVIDDSSWVLPLSFLSGVAILDVPLPQPFSSPRACLTQGLERGLLESTIGDDPTAYRYVLLNLPQSLASGASARKPNARKTQVLVRVPNQSTRARAHIEYFPERGEEIPGSLERALWILDSFLFPKSVMGRIDPSSCRILKWEETSIAHALASVDDAIPPSAIPYDPIGHWDCLAQLLQAIPSIGQHGSYLLCRPSRDQTSSSRSVSVHMETQTDGVIHLDQELARADEVKLGFEAVRGSFRHWRWHHDRVSHTFPFQDSEGGGEHTTSKQKHRS